MIMLEDRFHSFALKNSIGKLEQWGAFKVLAIFSFHDYSHKTGCKDFHLMICFSMSESFLFYFHLRTINFLHFLRFVIFLMFFRFCIGLIYPPSIEGVKNFLSWCFLFFSLALLLLHSYDFLILPIFVPTLYNRFVWKVRVSWFFLLFLSIKYFYNLKIAWCFSL